MSYAVRVPWHEVYTAPDDPNYSNRAAEYAARLSQTFGRPLLTEREYVRWNGVESFPQELGLVYRATTAAGSLWLMLNLPRSAEALPEENP